MQKCSLNPRGPGLRLLAGAVVLVVLACVAGLIGYATRSHRSTAKGTAAAASSPAAPAAAPSGSASAASAAGAARGRLPVQPATDDPVAYAQAAALALWSYDTRAYSQPQLVTALNGWLTAEKQYADKDSVDSLIPSAQTWEGMAAQGQFATATVAKAAYPQAFTQAMAADPGAITQAYVYAVTVTGTQTIGWNGAPRGGVQGMSITLAVQCRPHSICALAGVLPAPAP
ncbi:hypothetical protein GXW83_28230 [Streptacidiphilus sp. PB12-B1b]|uniref:hypothetical protein n=1 Tax=Streptacidiphilus sp. PB12-B1b TaxID=2705012 RepID=UPI0015FB8D94|nr:hypothetical protein [Streptacidiphilus sp. PB12-B1b]QMU79016.1 hypothetical protein GXW83_28230 [Streptacidiphilus sp. PB12-B1b]